MSAILIPVWGGEGRPVLILLYLSRNILHTALHRELFQGGPPHLCDRHPTSGGELSHSIPPQRWVVLFHPTSGGEFSYFISAQEVSCFFNSTSGGELSHSAYLRRWAVLFHPTSGRDLSYSNPPHLRRW
jgi:hypothetical protein